MSKMKKRADGRYCKEVYLDRLPNGKYRRVAVYGKTQKEVLEKAAEIKRQFEEGILIENPNVTFSEMAKIWIENCKPDIGDPHKLNYEQIIGKHLDPNIGTLKLKDLKPLHLQKIINKMDEEGLATATMKMVKLTASQILEAAIDNNLLIRNVFKKITIPKKPPKTRRALVDSEIRMITEHWNDHRMSLSAMIMLYCGLRRGEMIALDWKDINLEKRTLTVSKSARVFPNQPIVKTPKTEAGIRTIPIPEVLMVALRHSQKKEGLICTQTDGKSMMTESSWSRAWNSYLYHLNLQYGGKPATGGKGVTWVIDNKITPHMLRHTYATLLYDAGVDVKSAQKYMGHSSVDVTLEIYTHLSRFREEESINALDKHLKDQGIEKASKARAVV